MRRATPVVRQFAIAFWLMAALTGPATADGVPQSVKIQGYLSDRVGGTLVPANGVYSMVFEIFDVAFGGVALTTVGPVNLQVTNGVYEATIPAGTGLFDGPSRFLQITVNNELLSPRLQINSTPFALRSGIAVEAEAVAPGSIVPESMAPEAVTSVAMANASVTVAKLNIPCVDGQVLLSSSGTWICANPPAAQQVCPSGSFLHCYTGPPNTMGVGVCEPGMTPCRSDGTGFEACTGDVTPTPEACDGLDNDCDGAADEGCGGSVCGDGLIQAGEVCDDSNTTSGDGCTATCAVEPGYQCAGAPSVCTPMAWCGNGVLEEGEACDDFNNTDGDGCREACLVEAGYQCVSEPSVCAPVCGDGLIRPFEVCDDFNTTEGDGCASYCGVEQGYQCAGEPSVCAPVCGDGLILAGETCDDLNTTEGDGCTSTCAVEEGYQCAGVPSVCTPICGDGLIQPGEACDDFNTTSGDGCSSTCAGEPGYQCDGAPSVCWPI